MFFYKYNLYLFISLVYSKNSYTQDEARHVFKTPI